MITLLTALGFYIFFMGLLRLTLREEKQNQKFVLVEIIKDIDHRRN
jgi:hypothetical protein